MKFSTLRMIAIVCILVVGFLMVAPFVPTVEAGVTKKTITAYWYQCIRTDDAVCISPMTWQTVKTEEGWWHRNFGAHPHGATLEEITISRTQVVLSCSDCDPSSS